MRHLRLIAAIAAVGLLLGGCGGDMASNGTRGNTSQDRAETLAVTWALTKAGTLAYVAVCRVKPESSLCSEAVVDGAVKALQLGDVAIAAAQSAMATAGSDASARAKALALGLSAIALFQQTILSYGVPSG